MLRLHSQPKPSKDVGDAKSWRTSALLSHIGKALAKASVRPLGASSCKGCRPKPILLAPWKMHARCNSHPAKTCSRDSPTRTTKQVAAAVSSQVSCSDWEKAFDTIPRDRLWAAVSDAAKLKGLSVVLEAGHAGRCYIISKQPQKAHVTMGVRQESVDGPLCCILLYALSITQAQKKKLSNRKSLRWFHVETQ